MSFLLRIFCPSDEEEVAAIDAETQVNMTGENDESSNVPVEEIEEDHDGIPAEPDVAVDDHEVIVEPDEEINRRKNIILTAVRRGPEKGVTWHGLRLFVQRENVPIDTVFYTLLYDLIEGRIIKFPHRFLIRRRANRRHAEEQHLLMLHEFDSVPFPVRATDEDRERVLRFIRRVRVGVSYAQIPLINNTITDRLLRFELRALVEEGRIRQTRQEKFI
ncbi:hypothetical protein AVEN_196317-1 [Araneus ventricosus]|uniref:Uncharacterized protein n=1 Tax=Araneus ventricosus TaxID=182803 RepID=A0A4Y2ATU2_ARAVE|nr:hypothetical protein AVEN_196317-1 [Araneus ventricosus]